MAKCLKLASSRIVLLGTALFVASTLFFSLPAKADHSMGNRCIDCHSLRSTGVVSGSRNVLATQVTDALYNFDWYCGTGKWSDQKDGNGRITNALDCSYCHENDVADEIKAAIGGKIHSGVGSAHPVDVGGDGVSYNNADRIYCNDCHNGLLGPSGLGTIPQLTPDGLCSKTSTDGYPNHIDVKTSTTIATLPGQNNLAENPPRLTAPYGTDVDWGAASFAESDMLCFTCHDNNNSTSPDFSSPDESAMVNVLAEYNAPTGGHSIMGNNVGNMDTTRLACYHCHDPHAATDPVGTTHYNEALITVAGSVGITITNPYDSDAVSPFTFSGFTRAGGDRALCLSCHTGGVDIDGVTPVQFQSPTIAPTNLNFGFHENAHAAVETAGNCLNSNGGCHPSPHDVYGTSNGQNYCLGCHTSGNPLVPDSPGCSPEMAATASPDSEFNHIGAVADGAIKSVHNIPYDTAGDLTNADDNGCLWCHSVPGTTAGVLLGIPGGTTYPPPAMNDVESLSAYDAFCVYCHDGTGEPAESFGDTSGSAMYAPKVDKYFYNSGHGTGLNSDSFESNNLDSNIPCLECHVYHGSTAYKLLPGDSQTDDHANRAWCGGEDAGGRVAKGFNYSDNTEHTGVFFPIGGLTTTSGSLNIDYTDYSLRANNSRLNDDVAKTWKFENYTGSTWDTYYTSGSGTTAKPTGTEISYGTSGDMFDNAKVACGDEATDANGIGFCNACHFYRDNTDGTARATNGAYGFAYTHEGGAGLSDCNSETHKYNESSPKYFHKDCTDCHDPHGSGDGSATDNPNLFMVRGKLFAGNQSTYESYNVVLDEDQPTIDFVDVDGLDEDVAPNTDEICSVCHTRTDFHLRDGSGEPHNPNSNCLDCHSHNTNKAIKGSADLVGNNRWIGFGYPGGCDTCHGYPPKSDAQDTIHEIHVSFIADKLSIDLTPPVPSTNTSILCGPCHGENAASQNHLQFGSSAALLGTDAVRPYINIEVRSATTTSWGNNPSYGPDALPVGEPNVNKIPSVARTLANTRCGDLDCHGTDDDRNSYSYGPDDDIIDVSWYLYDYMNSSVANNDDLGSGTSDFDDGLERSQVCWACHDVFPADIRLYDGAATPALIYSKADYKGTVDAAANYYGNVSGYGTGGHGDPYISDPANSWYIDSDTSRTVSDADRFDCTACHDPAAAHIPSDPSNDNRLLNTTLENAGHTSGGLCNECHDGLDYPGSAPNWRHHPSYVPQAFNEVMVPVNNSTTWTLSASGNFEQNAYGGSGSATSLGKTYTFDQNPDRFIDWYDRGTNFTPEAESHNIYEPRGVFLGEDGTNGSSIEPRVMLPLEQYVVPPPSSSNNIMCVTCHNPHGSDLYVHNPAGTGDGRLMIESKMLRLKVTDSTLCDACH